MFVEKAYVSEDIFDKKPHIYDGIRKLLGDTPLKLSRIWTLKVYLVLPKRSFAPLNLRPSPTSSLWLEPGASSYNKYFFNELKEIR